MDLTIADIKERARGRVPKLFFDFADSGSWTENTYRANEEDFGKIKLSQRVLVDISDRRLETTMAGEPVSMPVAIAPTGLAGMQHAGGEILAAQAAEEMNVPFTLSTMSMCSIEDVAASTNKPFWFQLYVMKDREFTADLIRRAKASGCSTLVVTLDLQILGQRHKDLRNGLAVPPRLTPKHIAQMVVRPSWCLGMLRTRHKTFGNIAGHARNTGDMSSVAAWTSSQFDPQLSWKDIEWIRELWDGKLILKGVMCEEDAILACETGADAIIVSNHGGRQLDGAPSSISMLPRIVEAVDGKTEVHLDGGVRSGQDVLKALCHGARGVYLGRPILYGLGAGGKEGVLKALGIIRKELDLTLALCGERDVTALGRNNLARPMI